MHTFSVDTRGLMFFVSLAVFLVGGTVLYQAWLPIEAHMEAYEGEPSVLSEVDEHDDVVRAEVIERLTREPARAPLYVPDVPNGLPEDGRYVWIDAETGVLTLFEDNKAAAQYDVLRMPEDTSADALSAGIFAVNSVDDIQVSTVTKVRFPNFVKFGDRFALHGIPTTNTGEVFDEPYVGGGIMLPDFAAQSVASFVSPGMVVYVERDTPLVTPIEGYLSVRDTELPATSARSFALADLQSGQVFRVKTGTDRYPIASVTKLITAAVATEVYGHTALIRAPNDEYYTLGDLLYPLLLKSDNDVAANIAAHQNKSVFMAHMNAYLKARGMYDTSMADSSGLSPRNLSTADDLLALAKHLFYEKRYLLAISQEASMTITSRGGVDWSMHNQNKLASDPHFRGGKLGYTDEAGQTSLAIFNVPLGDETRPVAVIILGSYDWKQDTRTLLQWLVDNVGRE